MIEGSEITTFIFYTSSTDRGCGLYLNKILGLTAVIERTLNSLINYLYDIFDTDCLKSNLNQVFRKGAY